MKIIIVCVFLIIQAIQTQAQSKPGTMDTSLKSISCKLTTPELQKRKATVIAELKKLVLEKQELSNGFSYRFRASDDMIDKLSVFIKTERLCCDFFIFTSKVEGDYIDFDITGPEGAKQFLTDEVGF